MSGLHEGKSLLPVTVCVLRPSLTLDSTFTTCPLTDLQTTISRQQWHNSKGPGKNYPQNQKTSHVKSFNSTERSIIWFIHTMIFLNSIQKEKKNSSRVFLFFVLFWLHWVFVAARRLSLVVVSGGYSLLRCAGFSLQWLLLLRSMGSRLTGFRSCSTWASAVVARGLSSCSSQASLPAACGIFPDQGSNPCPLHWQADS